MTNIPICSVRCSHNRINNGRRTMDSRNNNDKLHKSMTVIACCTEYVCAKAQRRRRCLPNDNEWCQANIGISLISTDGKRQIDCSAYIFVVVVVVFCPIIELVGQIWLWAAGADERERSFPVFYCSSIDKVKYLNNFSHELARSAKRNEQIVSWNTKCAPNYHHHTQTPTHTQNLFAFDAQIPSS